MLISLSKLTITQAIMIEFIMIKTFISKVFLTFLLTYAFSYSLMASSQRIFVVEDEIVTIKVTQRLLAKHHLDVVVAKDLASAKSVDLSTITAIILDHNFPDSEGGSHGKYGPEFAAYARSQGFTGPILSASETDTAGDDSNFTTDLLGKLTLENVGVLLELLNENSDSSSMVEAESMEAETSIQE